MEPIHFNDEVLSPEKIKKPSLSSANYLKPGFLSLLIKKGKTGFFCVKMVLAGLLFLGFGKNVKAQDVPGLQDMKDWCIQYAHPDSETGDWGVDEYGYYINLYVRVRNKGARTSISSGTAYYETSDGASAPIFDFHARNDNAEAVTVEPRMTGVRLRAYNGTAENNTWSDYVSAGNTAVKYDGGSDLMEGYLKWYVPQSLMQKSFRVKLKVNIFAGNKNNYYEGYPNQNYTWYLFNIQPPAYNATFKFSASSKPGKMAVEYSYKSPIGKFSNYDYQLKQYMDDDNGNAISYNPNIFPSGTFDVNVGNTSQNHQLKTLSTSKSGITYVSVQNVAVPAYVWPEQFTATYDDKDSVKLTWTANINNLGTDYISNDQFEIQRSTDPDFATNTVTVTKYDYDPSKSAYEINDNLSNVQGGVHVYYRIRRTKSAGDWNWSFLRKTDLPIIINTTQKAKTVILDESNGAPQAKITWEGFKGVWTSGTIFSLKKYNTTIGTTSSIDLTEEQARSGSYLDDLSYCNEFAYSIIIKLGNSYNSPPETKVPGTVLAVNIGTITHLTASKGYFPERTELRWNSEGQFNNFIIKRKKYGSKDNFIQIATLPGSSTSSFQTDDSKGTPGVYYQYMVVGAVNCNNTIKYSRDSLYTIGFRSPTGNIYGRVNYENGQAVENVAVRLESNSNTPLGQSIYLNGSPLSYLKLDSLHTPIDDSAFTLETWVKPDDQSPRNMVIFSRKNQYELGFEGTGKLYFTYNGATVNANYSNPNHSFIHIAGIHRNDSLIIMVNGVELASVSTPFSTSSNIERTAYIGHNTGGQNFKGYIDEMRLWNRGLPNSEVARYYTTLLTGEEKDLVAYWRFDETISDQFYDLSHQLDQYNQNDGTMNESFVTRSNTIPTPDQLSLKAYTDVSGNYFISGIPYFGDNGTTYTIIPLFGTHQFDPLSVTRLLSSNSTSFTVDFTDNSSFPVVGTIYYYNSEVPVEGVQFEIDGKLAQENNGNIIKTDASGKFTISVPVGYHEVKAKKNNHVFVNDGKITDRLGNNLNYQNAVSAVELSDSTTIRFIGRVAGGALQEAFPLGHSLSSNNLGQQLSLTLKLNNPAFDLILGGTDSTLIVNHALPSNPAASVKIHQTNVVYSRDKVTVYPDPLTGEFEADLIPEKFNVTEVNATGWEDFLDSKKVSLDFTNKFVPQSSIHNYKDSTQSKEGTWSYQNYSDTVFYRDSYKFIKRVTPNFTITQLDKSEKSLDYFGDALFQSQSLSGEKDSIPLIDRTKTGKGLYVFAGHPVFTQGVNYTFKLKAFESYPFYESNNGKPVIGQKNNKDIIDEVPTADGSISIYNNIKNGPATPDTFRLDSTGMAMYQFIAGDPNSIAPGTKNFSTAIKFGPATTVNWKWFEAEQMQAFVTGSKQAGTDFVTAGPNKMLMVLRDPPGNNSNSFAEKGSTISSSTTYSGSLNNDNDIKATADLGAKVITWTGFLAGVILETEVVADLGLGVHLEQSYTTGNTKETTTTLTSRFQTSDDPAFVGAPADVFVGYSTNISYGQSNNLLIIRSQDKETGDVILNEGSSPDYLLIQRQGLSFGEKFGTLFAYPQQHIKEVLIPNLVKIRNTLLHSSDFPNGQAAANTTNSAFYVSKLKADDPNFGRSNKDKVFGEVIKTTTFDDGPSYKIYFPAGSKYRTDTISTLNQYVSQWEDELKNNEKEKLNSTLLQNYSFHAGNPVDYSEKKSTKETKTNSFEIIVSGSIFSKVGFEIMGMGVTLETNSSIGTKQGGSFENASENESTIGFHLAAGGVGEYISVDVNKVTDGGFAFRTKGGQTECPYEGEVKTKYYLPGTILDQPTIQMDKPQISVDKAVINGVPSSRPATFTLTMNNASEAQWSTNYVLGYGSTDSIQGALVAVDGASIAGGRTYPINYGQTITKTLTITKGPEAMDYNNIPIILQSACQYDPTGYQQIIADTVLISAHFIPSCSEVHIKSPSDKWVVNSKSPLNADNKRYLPLNIDQFDVNNKLFDHIELQYKPTSESNWTTVMKFYADTTKLKAAQGESELITNTQGINYNLVMDDGSFNDQEYDVQAVSYCLLGPDNYVNTVSNKISGIKDTYWPRLFGSPQPANGVLGISDQIRLNFNEPIAAGLLTAAKFQVTGIRNGSLGDHSVSVKLDGQSDYLATEFNKNLNGKNITAEMWILPDNLKDETIFSQGNTNESLELALTADKYLQVIIGKKTIRSDQPIDYQKDQWAHVALIYNATDGTVSATYNFVGVINNAPVENYNGIGHFEFGRSISKQGNFFGGKMHEARIWMKPLTAVQLQINSLKRLSGAEEGLMGYYPMNEGKGKVVIDKAHGSNAQLTGNWSTPAGKAYQFNGDGYIKVNSSYTPVTTAMDYTLELWFKAEAGQKEATLVSNGKGDGTEDSKDLFSLGFENGLLTFRNNGTMIQTAGNYLDNTWHHLAIAVNRNSGIAQVFVDGGLKKYFDVKNIGGIASAYTYLGARAWYDPNDATKVNYDQFFKGEIDELRLWNTYLNETLINKNNNVRLKGDEIGLLAYYPFEKYYEFQNNQEMDSTLSDMKIQEDTTVIPPGVGVNVLATNDKAPIIDRGPVANLLFDYVVNNDALIINLLEPKQVIDKTIITFKVKDVRDQHGNTLASPITWTAYIDQNQLKWSDNELNLSKELYSPLKFESVIINSGGNVQNFRLTNVPAWLTANPSAGTVDPKGNQKITFTVNEGLNVGNYNEIINMVNDNDEAEALTLNLAVNGQSPDWSVNPADYKYSMVVYGKIRIKNIFSSDKGDILAAFSNGKCVGVAHNTYFAANDFWYTFLTVYGDSLESKNLEFRIWDAGKGKVYEAIPSQNISFINEGIAGTSGTPVIFDASEIQYQNILLNKGWNWISFNLANNNMSNVSAALKNAQWQSGDIIKNNTEGFDQYSTTQNWVGTLSKLNNTSLFMLNTAIPQTLSMKGSPLNLKETPILIKGHRWNYIGYLPLVNLKIKDALAGYEASDEDVIKSQTGFSMYDSRNGWVGNLTYLKPGEGYMLYRKSNLEDTLVYPQISGNLIERKMGPVSNLQIPVEGNVAYAGNMTMVATVEEDFSLLPDDIILAYAGEELRAKALSLRNPVAGKSTFFLNISGEKQERINFKVERGGQIIAQSNTVVDYKLDTAFGTLKYPFILHFQNVNAEIENATKQVTISPNPFSNKINIQVRIAEQRGTDLHEVQISIYDVTGKLLIKRPKEQVINGYYETSWNGKNNDNIDCIRGVYLIQITIDEVPTVYKVIKK